MRTWRSFCYRQVKLRPATVSSTKALSVMKPLNVLCVIATARLAIQKDDFQKHKGIRISRLRIRALDPF